MPTYQYVCEACNDEFEVVQSFSDATLTKHDPGCGGHVRKRFNAVGVVFKGSGFYRNDSRGAESTSETASSSKPAAESSAPAKSESAAPASAPAAAPSSTPAAPSTPAKTSAA